MSVVPEDGITEHEKQPFPGSLGSDSPSSGNSTTAASSTNEHLLKESLFPEDSYTSDGVYWADLPRKERLAFINRQQNAEAKREFRWVLDMFKQDPMEPFRRYFRKYVMTGMGLFVEVRRSLSLRAG